MENKETEKNRTVINNPSPKDVYYEKLKRIEETQAGFNPDYQESTKYDHKENLKNSFEDVKVEPLQGRRKQILERPLKELKRTSLHIPADTRSAFPVISVQSPVSIQCCWQS